MQSRFVWTIVLSCCLLQATSAGAQPESEGSVATPEEGEPGTEEENCSGIVEAFARSGARKLFRAIDGHDLPIIALDWNETIEIPVEGRIEESLTFRVLREKGGKAIGLVGLGVDNRTFVLVETTLGPVVASLTWPNLETIESRGACKPNGSHVEFPEVATPTIDVIPFEFWGLRVFWRLPPSFNPATSVSETTAPREVLQRILSSDS
jgi:hypothetical protein